MRFTAAVEDRTGWLGPVIQIWREDKTQPGLYYKTNDDFYIQISTPPCYESSNKVFQCMLMEDRHISVQPGDFLGLKIPPKRLDDLEIYFKAGGPTNLVFEG